MGVQNLKKATNKQYEIQIILYKEEISPDFHIICYKETFNGSKRAATKRARELQKEWKAEYYRLIEVVDCDVDERGRIILPKGIYDDWD